MLSIDEEIGVEERIQSNEQLLDLKAKGVAAYQNGTLYVARTYAVDSGVTSFETYCRAIGVDLTKKLVEIEDIHDVNESSSKHSHVHFKNSQAIQTFIEITTDAIKNRASDVHIVIQRTSAKIRQRIHGDLKTVGGFTCEDGEALCAGIYQALTDVADSHYTPSRLQDGRVPSSQLHPSIRDLVSGIRVATTPIQNGRLMVLRILYETGLNSLLDLGYRKDQLAMIDAMKRRTTGINLVVGPTGSGKSTTLKIILGDLNADYQGRLHILTIENPPEYPISGVNQVPVTNVDNAEDASEAFNRVVRGAMRLDPDCIMIGEVRDAETAEIAINSAMTGHRVWTTLHANNAISAIQRLLALNVAPDILDDSSIFHGICSQRLVKVLCPTCRIPYGALPEHDALYSRVQRSGLYDRLQPILKSGGPHDIHFTGNGCDVCNHIGTVSRTVVAETLVLNSSIMENIFDRRWMRARKVWLQNGGVTMMAHAIEKIRHGMVDPSSVEDVLDPIFIEEI